jgi:hypothetical protein
MPHKIFCAKMHAEAVLRAGAPSTRQDACRSGTIFRTSLFLHLDFVSILAKEQKPPIHRMWTSYHQLGSSLSKRAYIYNLAKLYHQNEPLCPLHCNFLLLFHEMKRNSNLSFCKYGTIRIWDDQWRSSNPGPQELQPSCRQLSCQMRDVSVSSFSTHAFFLLTLHWIKMYFSTQCSECLHARYTPSQTQMAQFLEVGLPAQNLERSSITSVFEFHMVVLEWTIQMKGIECTCMIATFSKIPCIPIA